MARIIGTHKIPTYRINNNNVFCRILSEKDSLEACNKLHAAGPQKVDQAYSNLEEGYNGAATMDRRKSVAAPVWGAAALKPLSCTVAAFCSLSFSVEMLWYSVPRHCTEKKYFRCKGGLGILIQIGDDKPFDDEGHCHPLSATSARRPPPPARHRRPPPPATASHHLRHRRPPPPPPPTTTSGHRRQPRPAATSGHHLRPPPPPPLATTSATVDHHLGPPPPATSGHRHLRHRRPPPPATAGHHLRHRRPLPSFYIAITLLQTIQKKSRGLLGFSSLYLTQELNSSLSSSRKPSNVGSKPPLPFSLLKPSSNPTPTSTVLDTSELSQTPNATQPRLDLPQPKSPSTHVFFFPQALTLMWAPKIRAPASACLRATHFRNCYGRAHLPAQCPIAEEPRGRIYVFEQLSQPEAPTIKRIVAGGRISVVTANTTTLPTGLPAPEENDVEASYVEEGLRGERESRKMLSSRLSNNSQSTLSTYRPKNHKEHSYPG
ncbi:hypothetical protein M5K25_026657 [Dendrobium thyrsiflorum]|uniref:Uncharacterized protein n=1 Tax=Dendrobium thyrsiflorum TaxID=117978 RepID=A0ABD0TXY5_DENTH